MNNKVYLLIPNPTSSYEEADLNIDLIFVNENDVVKE